MPFQRRLFGLACWLGRFAGVCATGTRSPLGEPSENAKPVYRSHLMGVPVKSAFALLLTKVTKPENVEIYRWEMKKCRER